MTDARQGVNRKFSVGHLCSSFFAELNLRIRAWLDHYAIFVISVRWKIIRVVVTFSRGRLFKNK